MSAVASFCWTACLNLPASGWVATNCKPLACHGDVLVKLLKEVTDRDNRGQPLRVTFRAIGEAADHVFCRLLAGATAILATSEGCGGNRTHAAKKLGISRRALIYKLRAIEQEERTGTESTEA